MADLLTQIKRNLLLYQNTTLSSVVTYKKGVLPPIPVFPAISIIPENEELISFSSGSKYKITRRVRLDTYARGLDTSSAHLQSINITNAIKDIVNAKYRWANAGGTDQCYNTLMDTEVYGDIIPYKNSFLQKSSLTINCYSWETLPTQTLSVTPTEEGAKNFLTTIYDKIRGYKSTTLSNVKLFAKGTTPPFKVYPALVVSENTEEPIHYEAGRDKLEREFEIAIYHKLLDKEAILDRVMTEIDNVKTLVLTNPKWDGSAVWSRISEIQYGIFTNETSFLYTAFLTFTADCKKVLA